jgi:hypothetical protein
MAGQSEHLYIETNDARLHVVAMGDPVVNPLFSCLDFPNSGIVGATKFLFSSSLDSG